MPTSTVEDYLKRILIEQERSGGERVPTGRIAETLAVTPGTVTSMLKTLAESGLVDYEAYGGAGLTKAGRQLALHVLRRHRLIELFLVEILGLDWSEVHAEAERLEHAVSDRVIERIDELLGRPEVDPHGDPIPSAEGFVEPEELVALDRVSAGRRVRVGRVADQDAEFLRHLERIGLLPGSRLKVAAREELGDALELDFGRGRRATLGLRAAGKIFVELV